MKTIFFDIETGPLPENELAALLPPFDPAEVKTGNIKDPEKIAAKIAEAELNHKRDFIEKAALDPLSGRVVAIGLLDADSGEFKVIGHDDEAKTLREFWDVCRGRYWAEQMIDLRDGWQLGDKQVRGSLGVIAKHLGVGEKNGDGKDFAALWNADRAKAIKYLRNDLQLTAKVAEGLGMYAPRVQELAY